MKSIPLTASSTVKGSSYDCGLWVAKLCKAFIANLHADYLFAEENRFPLAASLREWPSKRCVAHSDSQQGDVRSN